YYGPPGDAPGYFGVGRISEIYERLVDQDLAKWEEKFAGSEFHATFVAKRLGELPVPAAEKFVPPADGTLVLSPSSPHLGSPSPKSQLFADRIRELRQRVGRVREWFLPIEEQIHQFLVLTARYAELVWGDQRT